MHRFHDVRDIQISPEGKWIAYTLSTVDVAADKSDTDVWMVSWDGAQNVRVTTSPDAENAPRWSPDGRYLSFTSSRPGEAKGNQIWLLDRNGGEAQQFTDFKGRLSSYEWSPDSKKMLLVMADRDPGDDEKPPKPIVIVQGYPEAAPARLYLFDMATKKAEPLTSAKNIEVASPAWSPDGKYISFPGKDGKDSDRYNTWNVYTVEARAGAAPRQLTQYDGIQASASRGRAEWSPDGSRLVYLQTSGARQGAYNMNRPAVVSAAGGEPRLIAGKFDRGVSSPRFSTDGERVMFLVADDRWEYPASVPADGGAVQGMVRGPGIISSMEQGRDGRIALLSASDTSRGEVYVLEDGTLRRLTHHNDAVMAELKLGVTEEFSCKAKDGNEVHGLLVKPPDYEAGKKYPALLRIHDGPNGQDGHSFNFERQLFAANGYVVVAVNYRGSSGRGEAYQAAIPGDWGNKEVLDLQAAMDYVVSVGLADPERLGVGGWGYGGTLTSAISAKDHRFKAATIGEATALQAEQITTPTLFLGGEMYQALRSAGVPTQLVIYPGQFHGITRPSYRRDRMERYLAWYAKYLKSGKSAATGGGQ
jgi:dipeptidyl aminopeptidase/acylaminoacyl peptidase